MHNLKNTNGPRKRTSHKLQYILELTVVIGCALTMSLVAVAYAMEPGISSAKTDTTHEEQQVTQLMEDTTQSAFSVMPLSFTQLTEHTPLLTDAIEERTVENRPSITTTRLGVEVSSYDKDTDYTRLINELYDVVEATDDPDTVNHLLGLLEIYECQRNLKVEELYSDVEGYSVSYTFSAENTPEEIDRIVNPSYYDYTQAELEKLAAVVYAEAGSSWCTDYHQQCVASVVLNRVEDSRFPDTIHDVLYAPGQYPGTCSKTYYDARALENARLVLEEGPVVDAIWQANFKQGSEIVEVFDYRSDGHSVTYICR